MMTDEFLEGPFNCLTLRPYLGQPPGLLDQCWIYGHRNPCHGAPPIHHDHTPSHGASSIPYPMFHNYWLPMPYAGRVAGNAHSGGCETALDERLPSRDNSQGQQPFSHRDILTMTRFTHRPH